MHKATFKVSFVLLVGLFLLFLTPKSAQNALRSQFLRPVLPLGYLLPSKNKAQRVPKKIYKPLVPDLEAIKSDAVIAQIIYRHPSTWNDFFWIKLGKRSNQEKQQIVRYSPVLYEGRLIGVVDYVGEKQSRVQLITNSNTSISVRSIRGQKQYDPLYEAIHLLKSHPTLENEITLHEALDEVQKKLLAKPHTTYLAKGELYGKGEPLWRSQATVLKGRGFQCEYEDTLSAKRDLITGKDPKDRIGVEIPLIEPGDLLVTTGFDGIFPAGLEVARVTEVEDLSEGAFSYSIKALPLAPKLKDLNFVEVILPQEYESITPGLPAFEN